MLFPPTFPLAFQLERDAPCRLFQLSYGMSSPAGGALTPLVSRCGYFAETFHPAKRYIFSDTGPLVVFARLDVNRKGASLMPRVFPPGLLFDFSHSRCFEARPFFSGI